MSSILGRLGKRKKRLARERKERQDLHRESLFGDGAAKIMAALTEAVWEPVKEPNMTARILKDVRRLRGQQ